MPGPQLIHGDAALLREPGIDFRLGAPERFARQIVEPIEQRHDLFLGLLVQVKLHGVIVLEPKPVRGLIAQSDQLLEIFLYQVAYGLAGFPHRLSSVRILRFLQRFAHLAVRHLLVIHPGPENVEALFNGIGLGGDLL